MDEQGAKSILDALLEGIKDKESGLQAEFGNYKVSILNNTTSVVTDAELYDSQQRASDMLTTLQKSLTDKKAAMDEMKEPTPPSSISITASLKSGIKYGVLGGVLGAFLSIFCICVAFLMSDKLSSEKELKNRFGLKILAYLPRRRKRGYFQGSTAGWIGLKGSPLKSLRRSMK